MSGFPRSGSTLLTCLLNQNPEIYASHASELITAIYDYQTNASGYEGLNLNLMKDNYINVYKEMPQSFYRNEPKPIVIDKNLKWGVPYGINTAKEFTDDVKIIYVYRPLLEVLASFIQLAKKNPKTNYIDSQIMKEDFLVQYYRPIDDARCEWLMQPNKNIDTALLALGMALKDEYKHMFHIVHYDDIVNNTQKTLSGIYNFLGTDDYTHDLKNLKEYYNPEDRKILGVPDMHRVRNQIKKQSLPPEKVLSKYIIEKYKNTTESMGMKDYRV